MGAAWRVERIEGFEGVEGIEGDGALYAEGQLQGLWRAVFSLLVSRRNQPGVKGFFARRPVPVADLSAIPFDGPLDLKQREKARALLPAFRLCSNSRREGHALELDQVFPRFREIAAEALS